MKRMVKALAMLTVAVLTAACTRGVVYNHYVDAPFEGWSRTDSLTFDISPVKEAGNYRLDGGLRYNGNYPFTTVALVVSTEVIPGHTVQSDTVMCAMANKDGKRTGTGVNLYQTRCDIGTVDLNEGDSLHVTVHHIMKRTELPGIVNVGIKLSHNQ